MDWDAIKTTLLNWILNTGIKLVISIVILLVSYWIINRIARRLQKKLGEKQKLDKTLTKVLIYIGKIALKCLIAVALIGFLGIDTSAFAALFASLGVCVGLAVNGALGNIAGGILLIITRPFNVDDLIEVAGHLGIVEDIRLCNTKLRTLDNKVVYIPNGVASTSSVVNYSEKDIRRVDIDFSISYASDSAKAIALALETAAKDERILKEPAEPFAEVSKYDANAVILTTRNWVKSSDYWGVYFDLLKNVRKAFDENGIAIPFNQLDVHIKND